MHEVGITEELVQSILKDLKNYSQLKTVENIKIKVGKGLNIGEESLRFWFSHFSQGTLLEDVKLDIEFFSGNHISVEHIQAVCKENE